MDFKQKLWDFYAIAVTKLKQANHIIKLHKTLLIIREKLEKRKSTSILKTAKATSNDLIELHHSIKLKKSSRKKAALSIFQKTIKVRAKLLQCTSTVTEKQCLLIFQKWGAISIPLTLLGHGEGLIWLEKASVGISASSRTRLYRLKLTLYIPLGNQLATSAKSVAQV